jgi:major outer membrane protein
MKKLIVMILTIVSCGAAHALPLGNPTEPGLFTNGALFYSYGCYDFCDPCFHWYEGWSVRLGFSGDYVYNRHMEVEKFNEADITTTRLMTNAGYVALNFCNRCDVFATFGATQLQFFGNTSAFPLTTYVEERMDVHFSTHFSWSVGGRAIVWEMGCFGVGVEGQYFKTSPDLDFVIAGPDYNYLSLSNASSTYDEWQVGAGISYRFEVNCPDIAVVPYLGVSWSKAELKLDGSDVLIDAGTNLLTFVDLESKMPWSYSVGFSLTFFEILGFSVEGRFAGQKALYVNGQVRF